MRIRKRQVPLPFSSISPVPLSSDPNFNGPPMAVVQLPLRQQQLPPPPPTTPCCFDTHHPSESDHPNHLIGQPLPTQALDSSAFHGTTTHGEQLMKTKQDYSDLKPGEGGEEDEEEKKNDSGKRSVLGKELGTGFLSQSSSSQYQAAGRWGEGEKPFPLKKRGGVEGDDDDTIMVKNEYNKRAVKSNAGKMKTKLNKKLMQQRSNNEQVMNGSDGVDVDNNSNPSGAKMRGRGGELMEGSRCSRVNGRGWRCCQQTLVGYSLCEHHLGKGRLRSIASVRSRAKEEQQANNANHQAWILSNSPSSSQPLGKQTKGESGENGKPLMIAKKRVKLGMVKARSISSLLGQDDNAVAEADDNNN